MSNTPKKQRVYRDALTAERLRELLSYDPLTGDFRWLVASNPSVHVGKLAGCDNGSGYRRISIDGIIYRAHRLAFLYMTGRFPDLDIDHADGDRSNNRWPNLREASRSENCANSRRPGHNKSGFKGIRRRKRKWCAEIRVSGRRIHLGSFDAPEAAHETYVAAAIKHFGEFACDGRRAHARTP